MTSILQRDTVIALIAEAVQAGASQQRACATILMSSRTLQRWKNDASAGRGDARPQRVQAPTNQLSALEREQVLSVANSVEFGHLPPSQIVPRLADQGTYIASESTFYRILRSENQLKHRNAEQPVSGRSKPRALKATAPRQLFSWDITYLPTEIRGVYFYLYLFLDIYSRHIVGWQVYDSENAELASEVMADICAREKIGPKQLVLHSDNGSPMKGATMLATLQKLGVAPSFSRPAVSNDNPYSEALFKTLKYRSLYPQRPFENLLTARQWVGSFVHWYNQEHRHSAIQFVTPAQRHTGLDVELLATRKALYEDAKMRHPERWSGQTRNWEPIAVVHLNPDKSIQADLDQRKGKPTLRKAALT